MKSNQINQELAQEILDIAMRHNKSIAAVLEFTGARVFLTDEECKRLAKSNVYSYETVRGVFERNCEY